MIKITIPGRPIEQKRPRACVRGAHGAIYTTQQAEQFTVRAMAAEQLPAGYQPPFGVLSATIVFYLPRPRSHMGTGRNRSRPRPSAPLAPAVKPDIDNLVKFVLDALNGTLFVDDSQIVALSARKHYADDRLGPRTEIRIERIGHEKPAS